VVKSVSTVQEAHAIDATTIITARSFLFLQKPMQACRVVARAYRRPTSVDLPLLSQRCVSLRYECSLSQFVSHLMHDLLFMPSHMGS
jgi:hypothetical protein